MNKAVVLLCFGDHTYAKWAFNLALSIKKHNPDIKIHLLHEADSLSHLSDYALSFFDKRTIIEHYDTHDGSGRLFPAKLKTGLYKYLEYDHNIYLDVDAVCMHDLDGLFDICIAKDTYFLTQIHSTHSIKDGEGEIPDMAWATAKTIWDHYALPEDAVLPATQSSFAYIKKCDQSEQLYILMKHNLLNGIPLDKLAFKWGGSMPDELILNVTLAQLGIAPSLDIDPVYFSNKSSSNFDFINSHFLLGIFGGKGITHSSLLNYYDRLMHNYCREGFGINHLYKAHQLIKNKFSGKK